MTALIYLSDVYGLPEVNNKLLADDFAQFFDVYAPDYLRGDPVPLSELNDPNVVEFLDIWKVNHTASETFPIILDLIEGLKKQGYKRFVSTGYCFGGPHAIKLAQLNLVAASSTSHPSFLTLPDDFVDLRKSSHVPFQINANVDNFFNISSQALVDRIMDGYKPGYVRNAFPGVPHGFAIRGNLSIPAEKEAKEAAFFDAVEWLSKH
ncbi:hypothetical protein BT69DRAFT_1356130 [Atractiella rhizophila]|nr:hypothetical protein BT69DRAFT_1356130 [Atractiella rhizophila]